MKKLTLLLFSLIVFTSCLDDSYTPNYTYEYLPIDEAITPDSLTFGEVDTIHIKYSLPNYCYSFDRIYYETQDTTRIVAVTALVNLDDDCAEQIIQEEYDIPIMASQKEDYIFKFFKGVDSDGENIFDEIIVPVN
ncbi:hypothetical protein [Polaribacter sargassicola]|uniref:hypothetical protein n=1 Tax=Polaribacter sargassicola TaxID=2836891 RepID=UPI001F3D8F64|nr:hypothetical protein [Polaribacter sp. DS7-9]